MQSLFLIFFQVGFVMLALILASCAGKPTTGAHAIVVYANAETQPVNNSDDAADDPAVWVHPTDASLSVIMGTDKSQKQGGLYAYNLQGEIICSTPGLGLNNVDLRQGVSFANSTLDIVGATRRIDSTLALYSWEKQCFVKLPGEPIKTTDPKGPYGFCMGRGKKGELYAFNIGKSGYVEQFEISINEKKEVSGKLVRTRKFSSQGEGCVADDAQGVLWVGEEDVGLWKYPLDPNDESAGELVAKVGESKLKDDVEGVALYVQGDSGYVVVSSQGDNTFALYKRQSPHSYVGSFSVGDSKAIGAVEETDGIEVISTPLGEKYPMGIFLAQDGFNQPNNQNFKMVDWREISRALNLQTP